MKTSGIRVLPDGTMVANRSGQVAVLLCTGVPQGGAKVC